MPERFSIRLLARLGLTTLKRAAERERTLEDARQAWDRVSDEGHRLLLKERARREKLEYDLALLLDQAWPRRTRGYFKISERTAEGVARRLEHLAGPRNSDAD
jgi:hypothetical protein